MGFNFSTNESNILRLVLISLVDIMKFRKLLRKISRRLKKKRSWMKKKINWFRGINWEKSRVTVK